MSLEIAFVLSVLIIVVGVAFCVWWIWRDSRWIRLRVLASVFTTVCTTIGAGGLAKGAGVQLPFEQIIWSVTILGVLPIIGLLIFEGFVTWRESSDRLLDDLEYVIDHHLKQGKTIAQVAKELRVSRHYVARIVQIIVEAKSLP